MSDSDSGSDKTPPPKKGKKAPKRKAEEKTADGDEMLELGQKKFVTAREWKGKAMVDIREFYEKDGKMMPGKKGISLSKEQWAGLKDHMAAIDAKLDAF